MSGTERHNAGVAGDCLRYHARHALQVQMAIARLQQTAEDQGNIFSELMSAGKVCSLGQISGALYEVGGISRRNM